MNKIREIIAAQGADVCAMAYKFYAETGRMEKVRAMFDDNGGDTSTVTDGDLRKMIIAGLCIKEGWTK